MASRTAPLLCLLAATGAYAREQVMSGASDAQESAALINRALEAWRLERAALENTTRGKEAASSCCKCEGCNGCSSFSSKAPNLNRDLVSIAGAGPERRLTASSISKRTDCCAFCRRPSAVATPRAAHRALAVRAGPLLAAPGHASRFRAPAAAREVPATATGTQKEPRVEVNAPGKEEEFSLVGETLQRCSTDDDKRTTGFWQTGYCQADPLQHMVCVALSQEFLFMTEDVWLSEYVTPGQHWCVPAWAWASAVSRDPKNYEGLQLKCEATNAKVRDVYEEYGIFEGPTDIEYAGLPALTEANKICGNLERQNLRDSPLAGMLSPDGLPHGGIPPEWMAQSLFEVPVPPEQKRGSQLFTLFMLASLVGIFLTAAALSARCTVLRPWVAVFALAPVFVFFFACSGPDFDYLSLHYK